MHPAAPDTHLSTTNYRNRGLQAGSDAALMRLPGVGPPCGSRSPSPSLTSRESVSLTGGSEHPVGCGITWSLLPEVKPRTLKVDDGRWQTLWPHHQQRQGYPW